MKGSIQFEKKRGGYTVWWYVPEKKRSVPIRHYNGVKLYHIKMAEKLLAAIQGTFEKAQRGECVFRIENFQKGQSIDVIELFENWLETKDKLKPGGLSVYTSHYKTWIKPFFLARNIALHEIDLNTVNLLKKQVEKNGKAPKTVKNVIDTMHSFLDYAWRNGSIIAIPPFPKKSEYGLGLKSIPTIPRTVQFEIINLIPEHHQPIFLWLVLHPGRRPGEAMAIQKDDYNQFKNTFTISHAISDRKLVQYPKNGQHHEIPCHDSFIPFLYDLLKSDSKFLFVNPRARNEGKRYGDNVLNNLWRQACKDYGISISMYNGTKHSTLDYYYNDLQVPLTDLMELTGHQNLESIKQYSRMNVERKRRLLDLENDAPHLKLISLKKINSHQIVTTPNFDDKKTNKNKAL
ncbi:MAG: site-specific integrase [Thermodesulfobacteriota bacterium]|nr:site-specific integrase [Thermodesulfobacteriota bacterium]